MAGTSQFVDISSYNGTIDFSAYCAWAKQFDGISRIAMKATEGVGFTDPQFAANRAGALAAGIGQIFYYHYGRPDLGNSPANEANWCHNAIGDIRDSDMIMLDYEVENGLAIAQWAYEWLAQQKAIYGGKLPGLYASSAYIEARLQDARLAEFPLWLANWQFTPDERPPAPSPWTSYEAVQYTDRAANIPGIPGNVDADIFLGGPIVNNTTYGPNSDDFNAYFTVDAQGNWVAKLTNAVIIGGNKGTFSELSIDGNTLPIIGLPLENEQYHTEADGYSWSTQRFERATMVYDPANRFDDQPGMGASYLAHQQTQTVTIVPDALKADLQALPAALQGVVTKLLQDAGLPTQ